MWSRGPSKFKTFKLLQFLDDRPAAGLILIPLIILPLDILAHFTMNSSYRRIGNNILGVDPCEPVP